MAKAREDRPEDQKALLSEQQLLLGAGWVLGERGVRKRKRFYKNFDDSKLQEGIKPFGRRVYTFTPALRFSPGPGVKLAPPCSGGVNRPPPTRTAQLGPAPSRLCPLPRAPVQGASGDGRALGSWELDWTPSVSRDAPGSLGGDLTGAARSVSAPRPLVGVWAGPPAPPSPFRP